MATNPNLWAPQQQQPMQMPSMPVPNPQQGMMSQILNSPGAAMAFQAMENIGNLQQSRPMRQSPIQAYQAAVAGQANQRMKEDQFNRRMDPFYSFEEAKRRGHIDPEMSYAEWLSMSRSPISRTTTDRDMETYLKLKETNPEAAEIFAEWKLKSDVVGIGGGMYGRRGAGEDQFTPIGGISPEGVAGREAGLKSAVKGAEQWADINADWEAAFSESAPRLQDAMDTVQEVVDYIEANPDMPTGMVQGWVTPKTNEAVSYLQTMATLLAIPRLQEAKLNPVTELELQKIMETFADALKDPKANIASLKASLNDMIRIANRMEAQQSYLSDKGTLKGYGADTFKFNIPQRAKPPGNAIKGPSRPGS